MFEFILRGLQFGVTAGTSPGPVQTYIITSALTLGWRRALILCLIPVITDIPLIILMVFVLSALPDVVIFSLQVVGGLFLLWIAWGLIQQLRAGAQIGGEVDTALTQVSSLRVLRRGVTIALLSPSPYIVWGTVNGPLLVRALHESIWHGAAFLIAFYGSFMILILLIVVIFDRLRQLDPSIIRWILVGTVLILIWFALTTLGQGVSGWVGLLTSATTR